VAKYFSRDEAEALLPQVEPFLREIQTLRVRMVERETQLGELRAKTASNGHAGPGEVHDLQAELVALGEEITERVGRINALGILVKDLEMGLIDFPTLREDREVYLCWKLGEQGIDWWHEVDSGYAGRRPLED
jgi:hypothetical protein